MGCGDGARVRKLISCSAAAAYSDALAALIKFSLLLALSGWFAIKFTSKHQTAALCRQIKCQTISCAEDALMQNSVK